MNTSYKVLIIGIITDKHIQRLICNLRNENPYAQIDFFATSMAKAVPDDVIRCINTFVLVNNRYSALSSFFIFKPVFKLFSTLRKLRSLENKKYDAINIHYPCMHHYLYMYSLRKMTDVILLTPWGSDVYRANSLQMFFLKRLYMKADKVCCTDNRFGKDVKRIFNLPDSKLVKLDIGSETIDYICDNLEKVSKEDAKSFWGVDNKYVITCSYNGGEAHRHEIMIRAISKVRDHLPERLVLFFPFTYAGTHEYANRLKSLLDELHLDYLFFEKYLSVEELFKMRRSSDMFIHIQPTDANAQSIQEYLLCGSKVVNGDWLRYSELEREGVLPYFLVKDLDSLNEAILNAFNSDSISIPESTIEYIKSYGWKSWIKKWNSFLLNCVNS